MISNELLLETPVEQLEAIARRFKELRLAANVRQADLAKRSGVGIATIHPSHRVEQQIGEETVELNQAAGRDREPDGRKHGGGGEELLHGGADGEGRVFEAVGAQRGETVILSSDSSNLPLVSSPKAARGQVAAARVLFKARGRSIWISFMAASLSLRMARR